MVWKLGLWWICFFPVSEEEGGISVTSREGFTGFSSLMGFPGSPAHAGAERDLG